MSRKRNQIVLGMGGMSAHGFKGITYLSNPAISKIDSLTNQLEQEKVFDGILNRGLIFTDQRFSDEHQFQRMVTKLNSKCLPKSPRQRVERPQ